MDVRRVMVIAEDELFREALASALDDVPDFHVVATGADSAEAFASAKLRQIDVALVSLSLPDGSAVCVCERLAATGHTRVVMIARRADVAALIDVLSHGAAGYVTRSSHMTDLVDTIREVAAGEMAVPRRMLGTLLHELIERRRRDDAALERFNRLSHREREVLSLLSRGNDHTQIASELVISAQTARTHIQNVLTKLGVHSRVEAAALAEAHGFANEVI